MAGSVLIIIAKFSKFDRAKVQQSYGCYFICNYHSSGCLVLKDTWNTLLPENWKSRRRDLVFSYFDAVLRLELKALCTLGKCSTTEFHPWSFT